MVKRILALVFIFLCATAAWITLGATIFLRTQSSDSNLRNEVGSIWGTAERQTPPTACYEVPFTRTEESEVDGRRIVKTVKGSTTTCLPLDSSRITVDIYLEPRQKGLLWYRTYKVDFAGDFTYRNTSGHDQVVNFSLPLPAEKAVYDDLVLEADGVSLAALPKAGAATGTARVAAGETAKLKASYHSQGLDRWDYSFGDGVEQVRDFRLKMTTNFKAIDFPENTLSPSQKSETASGWELTWAYKNMFSGFDVGMELPEKLQPGPLAGEISYFAPVSLFFFFFLMFILTTVRGIDLHPMNYFFLAAAFFAFHLLLAYLVDHISIHAAFAICSVVSVFLVISYLRLVVGLRFAAVEAGLTQFVYLVLFSYAFFFKGYTGLAVTIGSIGTLFVVMQMTGRIRWAEKFAPQTI